MRQHSLPRKKNIITPVHLDSEKKARPLETTSMSEDRHGMHNTNSSVLHSHTVVSFLTLVMHWRKNLLLDICMLYLTELGPQ
mmetsp:Transcript_7823/g.21471  ORF Transcript_7823/g.21471 Transcript_7823/m.21471 type:complete len:82 (-) Transcript_7823:1686-1931(-)